MKIAVVGSRSFKRLDLVRNFVSKLSIDDILVSGGAIGVDKIAESTALDLGIKTEIYLPDWDNFGKKAGIVRNETIVCNCEFVVAFWDGISSGTRSTINLAKKHCIPYHIIIKK